MDGAGGALWAARFVLGERRARRAVPYREGVKGARCDCEVNLGGRVRPQKRRPGAALQGVRPDDARSGGWVKMAT
jgi:hypothetical protein